MDYDHLLNRKLVTGMSGSGKTSLGIYLAKYWDSEPKPKWIYVFDPDREFARKCGWTVAITKDEINRLASQFRPVCFDPIPMFGEKTRAGLQWFCDHVMTSARLVNGTKLLIIDEVWKHTPHRKDLQPALAAMMHEGRRQEIDTLILSQQLNKTHADLRAQTTELYTFRQMDNKNVIKCLKEEGFDPAVVKKLDHPGGFILRDMMGFRTGKTTETGIPHFNASHQTRKANRPARVA